MKGELVSRQKVGLAIGEALRAFLHAYDAESGHMRIRKVFETLYEVATDKANRSNVQAAQILLERAYGAVPRENADKTQMLEALSGLSSEAKAYLMQKLFDKEQAPVDVSVPEDDGNDITARVRVMSPSAVAAVPRQP